MNDNEQTITRRLKELEAAVRKARLEAMQLAATLLAKENSLLVKPVANTNPTADLTMLRARYEGLVRTADDTQAQIDKLHAEEHTTKYNR